MSYTRPSLVALLVLLACGCASEVIPDSRADSGADVGDARDVTANCGDGACDPAMQFCYQDPASGSAGSCRIVPAP